MDSYLQDLRQGTRLLWRNPGFSLIALLTLALGIGASTAVFSVVNTILLKPLPYPDYERIMIPWRTTPPGLNLGFDEYPWGRVDFLFFAKQSKTFQSLAAFKSDTFNLTGTGEAAHLDGLRASADFFTVLGVNPTTGRTFTSEEDRPGHEDEVVLSYSLWKERFGGDSGVLGRTLELNGQAYTVIGVMPRDFAFPHSEEMPGSFNLPRTIQLWVPLALNQGPQIPAEPAELAVIGRAKPGVSIDQVQAEMNLMGKYLEDKNPRGKGWFNSHVVSLAEQTKSQTRRPLLLLLGAVGVVLLIACSNVASLLLTRSLGRTREFTVRSALGAGRGRLVLQILTENAVLAIAGGLCGIGVAGAGVRFLKTTGPANIPRLSEINLDIGVFAFALSIALLTGILFSMVPAFAAIHGNLAESLKEGGQRSGGSTKGSEVRKALIVSEVALAVVLVIAASLLVQTFFRMIHSDAGFRADRVLTFELSLPPSKYTTQGQKAQVYRKVLERVRALPGVSSAGLVATIPMSGETDSTGIRIPGRSRQDVKDAPYANYTIISPGYLAALRINLLRGRDFQESDTADSMPVALISEGMAKKFWAGMDPIGQQVGPGSTLYPAATIVGIVADVKHMSLRETPPPEMYVNYTQKVWPTMLTMDFALRTQADPAALSSGMREAVRSVDPDLPIAKISTLDALVDESMAQPRFAMLLLASFAALALALACVGMYGVISYSVAQRTREIGVRMALGARSTDIFRMILGQGGRLALLGIAMGVLAALGVAQLMKAFLYGVEATDALTFAGVSFLLFIIGLVACYVPARRAMQVNPVVALRHE
jgi:putative ABC transport system permease protein